MFLLIAKIPGIDIAINHARLYFPQSGGGTYVSNSAFNRLVFGEFKDQPIKQSSKGWNHLKLNKFRELENTVHEAPLLSNWLELIEFCQKNDMEDDIKKEAVALAEQVALNEDLQLPHKRSSEAYLMSASMFLALGMGDEAEAVLKNAEKSLSEYAYNQAYNEEEFSTITKICNELDMHLMGLRQGASIEDLKAPLNAYVI